MTKISSIPELIDAMGGATKLAAKTGWPVGSIGAWKSRGHIPKGRIEEVAKLAKAAGVKIDVIGVLRLTCRKEDV